MLQVRKKDGQLENFDFQKIKIAVSKAAARINYQISDTQ